MRYVGLTDNPERRKREHSNPPDFSVVREFASEDDAHQWEKGMLTRGYAGDMGDEGWRYGYTFSIT